MTSTVPPGLPAVARRRASRAAVVARLLACLVAPAVSGCDSSSPTRPGEVPSGGRTADIVAAGDIAICGAAATEATAQLLDRAPGVVLTLGDNAYFSGTDAEFRDCYEPTWGRHKSRTRPSPGNHDYYTAGATGYFAYFGSNAGPSGLGYYSYRAGDWLVLSLNSNVGAEAGSPQFEWVARELRSSPTPCALAYWHHPVVSSGQHGDNSQMRSLWTLLVESGVDVVLTGHDHLYERFGVLDAALRPSPDRGVRQFVVGTGGAPLYHFIGVKAGSEVRHSGWGVLQMTLLPGSYTWRFVPVAGEAFTDSGNDICR